MSRRVVLVLVPAFVLVFLLMAGCGGSATTTTASVTTTAAAGTTTTTASVTTTAAAGTTTTAAASTTKAAASTTKAAGAGATTATVSSTNGGYPKTNAPDWSQIKSVMAFRSASYGVASIWVSLANYDVTAKTLSEYRALPSPASGQGRIQILFTRTLPNQNEPPLVVGTYDFSKAQGTAELTGEAKVLVEKGTGIQFVQSGLENAVKITALSATEISGTFSIKDKWTAISGTFTAPLE